MAVSKILPKMMGHMKKQATITLIETDSKMTQRLDLAEM